MKPLLIAIQCSIAYSTSLKVNKVNKDLKECIIGEDFFRLENRTTRTHTINTVLNEQ